MSSENNASCVFRVEIISRHVSAINRNFCLNAMNVDLQPYNLVMILRLMSKLETQEMLDSHPWLLECDY